MKLYYHETSGGAEYYCLKPIEPQADGTIEGTEIGDLSTAVLRTDGDELEIFTRNLYDEFKKVVIS